MLNAYYLNTWKGSLIQFVGKTAENMYDLLLNPNVMETPQYTLIRRLGLEKGTFFTFNCKISVLNNILFLQFKIFKNINWVNT